MYGHEGRFGLSALLCLTVRHAAFITGQGSRGLSAFQEATQFAPKNFQGYVELAPGRCGNRAMC
jgi:hypothetical protein